MLPIIKIQYKETKFITTEKDIFDDGDRKNLSLRKIKSQNNPVKVNLTSPTSTASFTTLKELFIQCLP